MDWNFGCGIILVHAVDRSGEDYHFTRQHRTLSVAPPARRRVDSIELGWPVSASNCPLHRMRRHLPMPFVVARIRVSTHAGWRCGCEAAPPLLAHLSEDILWSPAAPELHRQTLVNRAFRSALLGSRASMRKCRLDRLSRSI